MFDFDNDARDAIDVEAVRMSQSEACQLLEDGRFRRIVILDANTMTERVRQEFDGPDAEDEAREFASWLSKAKGVLTVAFKAIDVRL